MVSTRRRHSTGAQALLEREEELADLGELLEATVSGHGAVAIVEGEAGIGKTALLESIVDDAEAAGCSVLSGRGAELERDFAYGVVRQLFEPTLHRLEGPERSNVLAGAAALGADVVASITAGLPTSTLAAQHGLYWLVANLSDRAPLVLAVDDAHWADPATLAFLAYLARRVEELPVLVVACVRLAEPGAPEAILASLYEASPVIVRPSLLSAYGIGEVIACEMAQPPDPDFRATCHAVTGGNPFLLGELLRTLASDGIRPVAEASAVVRQLGPAAISRSVLGRLARLWPAAAALARAVAVLDTDAELRHAAALAGLDLGDAQTAADALAGARILAPGRPLRFAHPILRQAVYAELRQGRRARDHARAARLLDADGAADRAAAHLLLADPGGDQWIVDRLRLAAARALSTGEPRSATILLARALAEPPSEEQRAEVLLALGSAEFRAGNPAAASHLEAALERAVDPAQRVEISNQLARALAVQGRAGEGLALVDRCIRGLSERDRELALKLEADALAYASLDTSLAAVVADRLAKFRDLTGSTPGERAGLAGLAIDSSMTARSAHEACDLAMRALADGKLLAENGVESPMYFRAVVALVSTDSHELADPELHRWMVEARRAGSVAGFAMASYCRAMSHYWRGDLIDAEADARAATDAERQHGWSLTLPGALGFLIDAQIDRALRTVAEEELHRAGLTAELPAGVFFNRLLLARGRMHLAAGHHQAAADDLLELGRRQESVGVRQMIVPWRSNAALALLALGRSEEAGALANEELAIARRWDAPRAVGMATRVVGLIAGGDDLVEHLRQAVEILAASPARLEHARALTDLGSALRRTRHRADARPVLRDAIELATRCGAQALVERAWHELRATGARPRKQVFTGADALTASERRVADMAASGMTNREIAQDLFVTAKTVETHLRQTYMKLDIKSRDQLPAALSNG